MELLIEKLSAIPTQQRWGGFALIVGALIFGYWFLSWDSASTRLQKQVAVLQSLEKQRAEKEAYVNNLADYESKLNELQQELNRARSELPDRPDVAQLLAQLGNKGRQSGLSIERFEPKGEVKREFYAEISFDVKVRGSYHEIGTFIDSLTQMDRIINVSNISMSSPKTVNQKVVLDGTFILKTYRYLSDKGGGL